MDNFRVPQSKNGKDDLRQSIDICKLFVATMNTVESDRNSIFEWFNDLCQYLTHIIPKIGPCVKSEPKCYEKPVENTIMLYLTQLLTTMSLLIDIFVTEEDNGFILQDCRDVVEKQLICCLEGLKSSAIKGETLENSSGNFVKWIDASLDKLGEIVDLKAITLIGDVKNLVEEVLSHAMSMAQVSLEQDSRIIRGSCQSVLESLNCLTIEISNKGEPNSSMVKLFVDSTSDKLCSLERKVNLAVLKLSLRTFADFTAPLVKIQQFCLANGDVKDFDNLVADFDLHVDRIMQIGLFAVSCSSDQARGIKIRSCLASLEALEIELVPVFSNILTGDRQGDQVRIKRANCDILAQHWLSQALLLQKLIFLIIDPFAFTQIVHDEVAEIVDRLSLKADKLLQRDDFKDLVKITGVLEQFFDKAQCEFESGEREKVQSKLRDFKNIFQEVRSACDYYLGESNCRENGLRVVKRCKILLTTIRRLWYCFSATGPTDDNVEGKNKVNEVDAIEPLMGNKFLDHIINRGKQIIEERSVMYKSPGKNQSRVIVKKSAVSESQSLRRMVHLRNLPFMKTSRSQLSITGGEDSLDLQITDFLVDLSDMSTNFTHL